VTLASDVYRPLRLAAIHARLYPDRFFNPVTSPALIHDATSRLRKLFRDHDLPLRIDEKDGFYRISASAPFAIRIAAQDILGQRYGIPLQKLRGNWPKDAFSIGQAVRFLGLPRRSTLRILQQAHEEGALERVGKARATRYAFKRSA
jgi:L-alanine-DL-glutamate epimerase-like enolase superfamily enzyme